MCCSICSRHNHKYQSQNGPRFIPNERGNERDYQTNYRNNEMRLVMISF